MAIAGDVASPPPRPPPNIVMMGPYTVFLTPPTTPKPPLSAVALPPVQPPPPRFHNSSAAVRSFSKPSSSSIFAFFSDAFSKVQIMHSSLDEHLAKWLGLNHSKYQWALNDYYEAHELGNGAVANAKDMSSKVQSV